MGEISDQPDKGELIGRGLLNEGPQHDRGMQVRCGLRLARVQHSSELRSSRDSMFAAPQLENAQDAGGPAAKGGGGRLGVSCLVVGALSPRPHDPTSSSSSVMVGRGRDATR
jgi:hypothetical protein